MKRFILIVLFLFSFCSSAFSQTFYLASYGVSVFSDFDSLFRDYPVYKIEHQGSGSLMVSVNKVFEGRLYASAGLKYIGDSEKLYFYSGSDGTYTLSAVYFSAGGGFYFQSVNGYFLMAGINGNLKLSEVMDTPYGSYDSDLLSDFLSYEIVTGKRIGRFLLGALLSGSIGSVFSSEFDSSQCFYFGIFWGIGI